MYKALFLILALITTSTHAHAELNVDKAVSITEDVTTHAQNIVNNQEYKFSNKQNELTNTVYELSNVLVSDTELQPEITELQETLVETEKLNALKIALKKELKSEPTAEELMTTYFELKTAEELKSIK